MVGKDDVAVPEELPVFGFVFALLANSPPDGAVLVVEPDPNNPLEGAVVVGAIDEFEPNSPPDGGAIVVAVALPKRLLDGAEDAVVPAKLANKPPPAEVVVG